MPCWPDAWDHIKRITPVIAEFVEIVGYTALVALLLWAPKLKKRWQRISSRLLGAAGVVPLVFAIPVILLGLGLNAGNPPTRTQVIESPDGQQAELSYSAGFLGRDYTEVTLKHTGCCRHITVFSHNGPSWFDDPKLEWRDNHHLQITYHTRPGDPQHCENKVGEITVTCTSLPWSNSPSRTTTSPKALHR
ncbi:MAG: hypothetical protein V4587_18570 [Acidobacteriota bacterium]